MESFAPPDPDTRKPRFSVPSGACDTQIHIYGPPRDYPLKPDRVYEPHIVGLPEMHRMHDTLGIARRVLISPTVYGTDNSFMVDALRDADDSFRGIAVIDDATSDAMLDEMNEVGVRGVRCNFASFLKMAPDPDLFRRTVARAARLGWHVVIHVLGEDLLEHEALFREVRIPLVVDHMAHLGRGEGDDDTDARALDVLLDLLKQDNWWIKLSNGDRISDEGPPAYSDAIPLGRALAEAAPDRAIWGTDWPHVLYRKPVMVNDGDGLNLLADYVPDETTRNRILVDNPRALYGFGG